MQNVKQSEVRGVANWNRLIRSLTHFITNTWQSTSDAVFALEHFQAERTPAGFLSGVHEGARGCTPTLTFTENLNVL